MAAEARAMLDSLMGGDRNAPIPKGAALPPSRKKRRKNNIQNHSSATNASNKAPNSQNKSRPMRLPGMRKRSCYDANVDPLYCAWGVDVYDLFVNTKSDIGTNPFIPDQDAYEEFQSLPNIEKERLGFEFMLYRRLQELVRSCDRTVSRNKEKLKNEIARALKNLPCDPIEIVDLEGVKRTSELMLAFEEGAKDLETLIKNLDKACDKVDTSIENYWNNDKVLTDVNPSTSQVVQKMLELQPLKEQIDTSKRSLYFYRSDTSTDKTVCEVSGNFMSSRDADERIAAHFAGKQYVGWKLVRNKCKELEKKFRNYKGPPPALQRMPMQRGPPPMNQRRPHSPPRRFDDRRDMSRGGRYPPPPMHHPPMHHRHDMDRDRGRNRRYR